MTEPVQWLPDGRPYSPRFSDIYRSEAGALAQSRHVFLHGCGLPEAWSHAPQWRILETGFGLGLNFLAAWHAWREDPARPAMLHFVSIEAWPVAADDLLRAVQDEPEVAPLAAELAAQWHGLLPGFHRLSFEGGRVLLTLCVGEVRDMLRALAFEADALYLDGFTPTRNPEMWTPATLKDAATHCRRGAAVATYTVARSVRDALKQAGFQVAKAEGLAPKRDRLQGRFDPPWAFTRRQSPASRASGRCAVVGAGLAGAAVAAGLARRGWDVLVLDRATEPAQGASGLPAGLFAPHVSPDDSLLSQLTRAGIRATVGEATARLRRGVDWDLCGVLEHAVDEPPSRLPDSWAQTGQAWSANAHEGHRRGAGLGLSAPALWHSQAGWIIPARLVEAWLAEPGIRWRGGVEIQSVVGADAAWRLIDSHNQTVAEVDLVILTAGPGCVSLLPSAALPLQTVRGQVSYGMAPQVPDWPKWPVNGHGFFIPRFPAGEGSMWLAGAGFDRDSQDLAATEADRAANQARLARLLPDCAAMESAFAQDNSVKDWVGLRCMAPDHLPLVGPAGPGQPWLSTAMGSRGLTFAALAAELLAARLHGEPLPLARRQAGALRADRFAAREAPSGPYPESPQKRPETRANAGE